jgi:ATP-dependent DNA ligase
LEAIYESLVPLGAKLREQPKMSYADIKKGKKPSKPRRIDYQNAIGDFYIEEYKKQGFDLPGMEWVQKYVESPMLAQRQNYVKPDEFEQILNSPEYVADIKLDGSRQILSFFPEVGFEMYGRNRGVGDMLHINYTDKIDGLLRSQTKGLLNHSFVIDGELTSVNPSINGRIVTGTCLEAVDVLLALETEDSWVAQKQGGYPLRFNAFDILMFDGEPLFDKSLMERLKILHRVMESIRSCFNDDRQSWFPEVERVIGGKEAKTGLFNKVRENKLGDGIIIKDGTSTYRSVEARGRALWLKMKISMSQTLGQDIDMFVSGYELGDKDKKFANLVGSLKFSVYLMPSGEVHELATVAGLSDEFRNQITVQGPDGPELDKGWLGRVAVVDGMDISARNRKFSHARITRWRDDKKSWDCKLEEVLLNEAVL